VLRALAVQMRSQIDTYLPERGSARVLDVGCGSRPYEAMFDGLVGEYTGVDWEQRPGVDIVASGAELPLPDASYHCVICSQVIEHVQYPHTTIAEVFRVLVPGGLALVSTHGLFRYHPNPDDYWRWTHKGLEELFGQNGAWTRVDITPNGGTAIALAYLLQYEAMVVARSVGLEKPWRVVTAAGNVFTRQAERLYRRAAGQRVPSLVPNYLVSATR
jgi:SAM-dependent methyltransferase